ncbi:choice-of-anchor U domain-containing protein [Lampropedia puyangensis]|nr:choice-of-anchor U domain-containing protein [Lampropedia puyangensis]
MQPWAPVHSKATPIVVKSSSGQLLYDNGPLSTGAISKSGATAPTGFEWSELQNDAGNTSEANTTLGLGSAYSSSSTHFLLADDFVVPAGATWTLSTVKLYAYQTGYSGTESPFNDYRLQIWNGPPDSAQSELLCGDDTNNQFISSSSSGMYRTGNSAIPSTAPPSTTRHIWETEAAIPSGCTAAGFFTPGTYWIGWTHRNIVLVNAGFTPTVAVEGMRSRPGDNAKQLDKISGVWTSLVDGGNPSTAPDVAVALPFKLYGSDSALPAPNSPTNVIAIAGNSVVTVQWDAPFNAGSVPITGYRATAVEDNTKFCTSTEALICEVSGLTNGTSYSFSVTASAGSNESAPSTPSNSVTPFDAQALTPSTTSSPLNSGSLTCTAPTAWGGTSACTISPATGFQIVAISGCGGAATGLGINQFTTGPLTSSCTVTAQLEKLSYSIFASPTPADAALHGGSVTCTPNPVEFEGTALCEAAPVPGYMLSGWAGACSHTPSSSNVCTLSNVTEEQTVSAQFIEVQTNFTGTTTPSEGTTAGPATVSFSGGGATCRVDPNNTAFVAAPETLPQGQAMPHGMLDFKLVGCDATPVTVTITWPDEVQGLTKWGKASANATSRSYFQPNDLAITGNTTTFTVQDGQLGDDDWEVNGEILDPVGATVPTTASTATVPVPAIDHFALTLLSVIAAGFGALSLRRRKVSVSR